MEKELQDYLQQSFQLPATIEDGAEAELFLALQMNELIKNNFHLLVQFLYRIDVNETKLKQVLKENPNEDAGKMIARLIIERQQQKIISRKKYAQRGADVDGAEKW